MKLAIIGAGPIGLHLAIMFKKKGIDVFITDSRSGNYTRQGVLNREIFSEIEKDIGEKIDVGKNDIGYFQIKDLELSLYAVALKLGIKIHHFKFVGLNGKNILLEDQNQQTISYACDYIIDASGPSRCVLKEINKIKPSTFELRAIHPNARKQFLLVAGEMSNEDIYALFPPETITANPIFKLSMLDYLRNNFQWPHLIFPEFYKFISRDKIVSIYVELPEKLPSTAYQSWVETILCLKTTKPGIQFLQWNKNYVSKFITNPQKVDQVFFDGVDQFPIVIPVGDAQQQKDFRAGDTILKNRERNRCLLDALRGYGNESKIDLIKYENSVSKLLEKHEVELLDHFTRIDDVACQELVSQRNVFLNAFQSASESNQVIEKYYGLLCEAMIEKFPAKIDDLLRRIMTNNQLKLDQYGLMNVESETILFNVIVFIDHLLAILSAEHAEAIKSKNQLKNIFTTYVQLAETAFARNQFGLCNKYANSALIIAGKYLQEELNDESLDVQALLLKNGIMMGDYRGVQERVKKILESNSGQFKNNVDVIAIIGQLALLKDIYTDHDFKKYSREEINSHLNKSQIFIEHQAKTNKTTPVLLQMKNLINEIRERMSTSVKKRVVHR